ncbi:ABC transporter substrate-binding protein [Modestobacter sp. I12A-02628]|uniref:ABC transporter substrate-binding protein n=1 Tax=Goekera deserti TaxID=2497753 RepID=A0A7K3WGA1_9ACTN|nr:ABC transporter substrate-binding protein [Goekera deserti]MPQ96611.1 ABC transporter substrate-binding protein [Goekera deserti]NDI47077.1 ABC transporter substrate-binding protein [Goekera deserti]NEL55525.1 ABC transporter substrate-binding protein [Goekera deserti]
MSRTTMRRRVAAASLAGVAVLAAGCRGGGEDPADGGGDAAGSVATDIGVTSEPCPEAVNQDTGCIYLGTLSDLTVGPFAPLGPSIVEGQKAFWNRVNTEGGIEGYEVNVTEYVRDNQYNPQVTNQVYREIKPDVLGLAQSLGSPPTASIVDDLTAENIVTAPAGWTSLYLFQDIIVESGASYCAEAMNGVDYAVGEYGAKSVMSVHLAGDFGGDAAAGVKVAADANGIEFTNVETTSGTDNQAAAISQILSQKPDLVVVSTGPADMATIVGQTVAQGFQGRFLGSSPTWNSALLKSPAAPALQAKYQLMAPWGPWDADTAGHEAARTALAGVTTPNESYISGWIWSYPMLAALKAAVESGDLTREGLATAASELTEVDFEGILPEGSGNYAGGPNEAASRTTVISNVDPTATTGVTVAEEALAGPTATEYDFTGPCYEEVDLG